MDREETQYTRVEYARKFLVSPRADWRSAVAPYSKTFEDKYISHTRLRLRILTDSDTGRQVIKLNKKSESDSPYFRTVSRILLSPNEYSVFNALEGDRLKKIRHYHYHQGQVFAVDVFEGELDGFVLCEVETDGLEALMAVEPPAYAQVEVTTDDFFTGGSLCRATRAELLARLSTLV